MLRPGSRTCTYQLSPFRASSAGGTFWLDFQPLFLPYLVAHPLAQERMLVDFAKMTDSECKVLESRLRRAARRQGLHLEKSRTRSSRGLRRVLVAR